VGSHSVLVGNDQGQYGETNAARGEYALRVILDAETPDKVSRVVFALGEQGLNTREDA
jgi:hypothetical protein